MAYVALYRRWRPQGFDALVGQEAVRTALTNALNTGRIAHAYLFAGPRGTGKTSTAKILAKALNCEQGPTAQPCNECANCQRINDGSSMDVFEIDAASNRGIDEIRDLREKVMFAPVNGRYKVYIIDEVHMLTTEAFNALLKTLEEPPAHIVFILATTEPHKIPATIHSRCQRFDFRRVTNADIEKRLREVADGSEINVDDEALKLIAIQSDGAMRDALSLLDQCGVMSELVTSETVRNVLGIVGREALRDLVAAIGSKDITLALQLLHKLTDQGKDIKQILTELTEYFRAILLYKTSPNYAEIYLTDTETEIDKLAKFFGADRLMAAAERLHQAISELRFSVRGRITAELCLVDLCRVDGSTLAALMARIEKLENALEENTNLASTLARKEIAQKEVVSSKEKVTPVIETIEPLMEQKLEDKPALEIEPTIKTVAETDVVEIAQPEVSNAVAKDALDYKGDWTTGEDIWKETLEILKNEKKQSMVACATGGYVTGYENGILTIGFKNKFMCERMNDPDYKKAFEEVLLRLTREDTRLECIVSNVKMSAKVVAKKTATVLAEQETTVQPMVKAALEAFGGKLEKL